MLFVKSVYATCPVCIVTVGGGLYIANKLGIDDSLVSIWISGLNTALAFYTAHWIYKKRETQKKDRNLLWKFIESPVIWSFIFYGFTLWYFAYSNELFHANNTLWGIDKIILGMSIGLVAFFVAVFTDKFARRKNNGKIFFPYQKVIIPVLFLILITAIMQLAL